MGHATACAAALAVQKAIDAEDLLANVKTQGVALMAALKQRLNSHPHIGDIRGRGLFVGVEFVTDKESKQPFDPARRIHITIKGAAMEQGLMCYPGGGTMDGKQGNHLLLAPPYTIEAHHVEEIATKLERALAIAFA